LLSLGRIGDILPKTTGNDQNYILNLPLEKINCSICEKDDTVIVARGHSDMVKCRKCGLVYFNPRPTMAALIEYYNSNSGYLPFLTETKGGAAPSPYYGKVLKIMTELTGKSESILEIGCGYGNFLFYAKQQGYSNLHGVEPCSEAAEFVKSKGIKVKKGTISDTNYPAETFNLVMMDHVLEHTPNPSGDLKEVARILKKGGIVSICVPNISSFSSFVQRDRWVFKSFPNHLYYFSPKSMENIVKAAGLELVELTSVPFHSGNVDKKILSDMRVPDFLAKRALPFILKNNWGPSILCFARKPK